MDCPSIIFALLLLLLASSDSTRAEAQQECEFGLDAAKQSAKPISDLALTFYRQMIKPDENYIFAPVSIALALALVEPGAAGVTKDEILALIGVKGSDDSSKPYQALQHQLQMQSEKAQLSIANGIFFSDKLRLKPDYVNFVKKCLEADVGQESFQKDPEESRLRINRWIADRTVGKIPELLRPQSIRSDTLAILAHGIYFKAPWSYQLMDGGEQLFYRSGKADQAQKVKFMALDRESFNYQSHNDFEVVELPYDGLPLSMFIILPKKRDGIDAVENSLTGDQLISIFGTTDIQRVSLSLPKFIVRQTTESVDPLVAKLGLQHMFWNQANFNGMSMDEMKITRAFHEAYIKVNENGTEAAVGRGLKIGRRGFITPSSISFVADHPFIFVIVHKPTLVPVFMGRLNSIDKQE